MQSGLRLALLKPACTSNPPIRSPIISVVIVELCFVILLNLFIAWQCSAVANWCTLCRGMPRLSKGVMVQ
jgi:hypothetical protein